MPTSARKSSLGTSRRATQKAHVPFRADELGRGKKTGIAVNYVDHRSDEFEPFEQVMSQADTKTPPRARNQQKGKKKGKAVQPIVEDEDENGEMSMDLDDSGYGESRLTLDGIQSSEQCGARCYGKCSYVFL